MHIGIRDSNLGDYKEIIIMKILGIKLNKSIKITYCKTDDNQKYNPRLGEEVIIETSRGLESGVVMMRLNTDKNSRYKNINNLLVRRCTDNDRKAIEKNVQMAKKGLEFCKRQSKNLNMGIKVVDSFVTYNSDKLIIYFTADGRVDFRKLVKMIATKFRVRIEMKQIGIRDGAGVFGGIGICGRSLCCASFKDNFGPITVNMAKDQSLSLNPTKISGVCGRLMCCLRYEHEVYKQNLKKLPKINEVIDTPEGKGTVMDIDLPRMLVKIKLEGSSEIKIINISEK